MTNAETIRNSLTTLVDESPCHTEGCTCAYIRAVPDALSALDGMETATSEDRRVMRQAADLIEQALPIRAARLCPACSSFPLADRSDEPACLCLCENCNEWTDNELWIAAANAAPLDPARAALKLLRDRLATPAGGR